MVFFCVILVFVGKTVCAAQGNGQPRGNGDNPKGVDIELRGEISLVATDNVRLTAGEGESDLVIGATPGINIRARSNRFEASVDYSMNYFYFLDQNKEDIRHNLFGLVGLDVVENAFRIEGRASIRQTFIDRAAGLSGSQANLTDNRRIVQTYSGLAQFQQAVSNWADIAVDYTYSLQQSTADDLDDDSLTINFSDTQSHQVNTRISSGDRFNRIGWVIFASGRRSNRNLDSRQFVDDRAGLEVSYDVTRDLEVYATAGYTDNNLVELILREDGFTWSGGFRYTPSRRTNLDISYGREGDREIWDGRFSSQLTRRIRLSASYVDRIEANSFQLASDVTNLQFSEDVGIVTENGLPVSTTDPAFSLSDVDFRQRRARLALTWRGRRTTAFVSGDWERRRFDDGSGTSLTWGGNTGVSRRLSRTAEVDLSFNFRRSRFEGSARSDDVYGARFGYQKTISRYFLGGFSYSFSRRDSNVSAGNLEENAVAVFLRGTF